MKITLEKLAVGEIGTISGYARGASVYRERLLSMGLTRGTRIRVERTAPMGDPIEIRIRDYSLTLRRGEASALLVEKEAKS